MKKVFLFLSAALFVCVFVYGQQNPVQWNASLKKLDENSYELHLKAGVDAGWHLYSQHTPAGGPLPSLVSIGANPLLVPENEIKEVGDLHKKNEPLFGVEVQYFNTQVDFVVRFKRKAKVKTNLKGKIEYMVCDDKQCLPPKIYSFELKVD